MARLLLCVALICTSTGLAHGQAPDASTVELAMNEGLELDFPFFQDLANVQILRGGESDAGEYLFLCTGQLIWKLGSEEFSTLMQQEIEEEIVLRGDDDTLRSALYLVLTGKLERIGEFAAGDTVLDVRFRVRLEQAGADWIVTESKIKGSDRNPLEIIDKGDP